jgi:hypothetical protein
MLKLKVFLIAGLLAAALTGLYIHANCSASATGAGCNASCSVNNVPTGGTSQCTSSAKRADCRGWDAAGNLCCGRGCICNGGFGGVLCYEHIGNTCC